LFVSASDYSFPIFPDLGQCQLLGPRYTQGKPGKDLQIHYYYDRLFAPWCAARVVSIAERWDSPTVVVLTSAWEWLNGLAVTDGVDCWRVLSDPFRRWDRCHRLVPRHVRLCNSGGDHGAGRYTYAGVHSSARSLLGGKAALSKSALNDQRFQLRLPNRPLGF
jgi:hypothetical protein